MVFSFPACAAPATGSTAAASAVQIVRRRRIRPRVVSFIFGVPLLCLQSRRFDAGFAAFFRTRTLLFHSKHHALAVTAACFGGAVQSAIGLKQKCGGGYSIATEFAEGKTEMVQDSFRPGIVRTCPRGKFECDARTLVAV